MPSSEQKRQKKLAKQQSRAKKAKRELARKKQVLNSLAGKMRLASRYPIVDCKMSDFSGPRPYMGRVILARRIAGGEIAMATFLLDCGCLGVKDVWGCYCSPGEYQSMVEQGREQMDLVDVTPERARAFIEQTLAYAAKLGFPPHPDFHKAYALFGEVDASQCSEVFSMGDDEGKPLYINGPFEDAARQRAIIAQLTASVGEGNFHFSIGGSPSVMNNLLSDHRFSEYVADDDDDFDGLDVDDLEVEDERFDASNDINASDWRRLDSE